MAAEVAKYVRIRVPRSKNEDVPRSITSGGVKIVQGGTGTLVKDEGLIKRLRKAHGEKLEVSNSPFEPGPKPSGVIEPGK